MRGRAVLQLIFPICKSLHMVLDCNILQFYDYAKLCRFRERGLFMRVVKSSRSIGRIVKEQRVEAGLTQKKLAKKAGVSERLIIALELGDATGIRLDKLLQVLSALDLSLGVLGAGDDEAMPKPQGTYDYAVVDFSDLPINFEMSPELTLPSLKE